MVTKLLLFVSCLLFFFRVQLNAQAYDINTFFNGSEYAFYNSDSNNYMLNECKTQQALENTLDSVYKLPTGSFYNAIDKITYSGNRTFISGLHNEIPAYDTIFKECAIDFTYDGINSSAFSFFVKSLGDTNTAFLIMPGSGTFQSLKVAEGNPTNYHNQSCLLKNMLRQRGDVYVYVKQNEEFRSIWKNYYSSGYFPKLDFDIIDPYTKLNGHDWQDNLFSEFNVWIHFLKQKYKRVVIMGLSAGGWPVMFSSLQLKPDAAILAAGFGVASYQNFPVPNNYNSILDGVLSAYPLDSLRKIVRSSTTEYLFTYGNLESGGLLYEYQTHSLQDTLQQPTHVKNLNFAYFSGPHTFYCPSIDTFLNRVLNKPKAIVRVDTTCAVDSTFATIELLGSPPFTFNLYKDNIFYDYSQVFSNSVTINLTENGAYQIKELNDTSSIDGYDSEIFNFRKDSNYIFQLVSNTYDCANDVTKLTFQLGNTGPWIVGYYVNGIPYSDTIYGNTHTFDFQNGFVYFETLNKLNGCGTTIWQGYTINNEALTIAPLLPVYNCDSNKTNIHLQLQGHAPWYVNYLFNGNFYQEIIPTASYDFLLNNGSYYFIDVTDANNCSVSINQGFTFDFHPISAALTAPVYDCDSNKTRIDFLLDGNSPFTAQYTYNSSNQTFTSNTLAEKYFSNGDYYFQQVIDATGCIAPVNTTHYFQADIVNATVSAPIYNCDSNKTKLHFSFAGRAPWKIRYQKNGVPQEFISTNTQYNLFIDNGNYFIQDVVDSALCVKSINQSYTFNYSPISVSTTLPIYSCDSNKTQIDFSVQGNQPYTFQYLRNSLNQSFTSNSNTSKYFTNGLYDFTFVTDATGCIDSLNVTHFINREALYVNLGTPLYNCDSNKTKIHFQATGNAPFTIHYFENLIAKQIHSSTNSFDVYFTDGSFLFQKIVDSTGCENFINQLYQFNYQPISGTITQQTYNCDSNKYQVSFAFTGTSPYVLEYTDGTTVYAVTTSLPSLDIFLTNGNWVINKVSNNAGCVQFFNVPFSLSFSVINGQIIDQVYDCDSNKLQVAFSLSGNAPWNIHYVINGVIPVYVTLNTYAPNQSIYLPNGSYTFLNVIDSTGCSIAPLFQTAVNDYQALSIQKISEVVNCDSLKTKIDYTLTGNTPWVLTYKNLATTITYTHTSNDSTLSLFLAPGNYQLLSLQDATCTIALNDTLQLQYQALYATHTTPSVFCDSNKFITAILAKGGIKPYQFDYYHNANALTTISNLDTTLIYLSNGNYLFATITDAIGCSYTMNEQVDVLYNDFSYTQVSSSYICEKDSSMLHLAIQHIDPIWLVYAKNGANNDTILLNGNDNFMGTNGIYQFTAIYDQYGCKDTLNRSLTINESVVAMQILSIDTDCAARSYAYTFALQGKSPWQLDYNYTNINNTLQINIDTFRWVIAAGQYYVGHVTDANNCTLLIDDTIDLAPFLPAQPTLTLSQNKVMTVLGGVLYRWYKNGALLHTTITNSIASQGNGDYSVTIEDKDGCLYYSTMLPVYSDASVVIYPNPAHNKVAILVNENYGKYWEYVVTDMSGRKIMNGLSSEALLELAIQHLPIGAYTMTIHFESDFSKHTMRFQKN